MCDGGKNKGEAGAGGDGGSTFTPANVSVEDLYDLANVTRLFKQCEDAADHVLKLLSDSNVNVMEPKPDGSSILHSFTMFGCYDVVKLLWDRRVQPTILHGNSSTLLHSAVTTQDGMQDDARSDILRLFLTSSEMLTSNSLPLDHRNRCGWTALKLAARMGLEKCVEVLIGHDADPDIPDREQFTALHNSVGNPTILKLLATKSRNIDALNHDGASALNCAAKRGLVESAMVLLEQGADPNCPNREGITPLFLASWSGNLELVRGLLKNNAAVNLQCGAQNTAPLHWAAHKEREDIALLLIEHGADILLKDREGRTPLSMAAPELAAKMTKGAVKANPSLCLPPSSTTVYPCMSAIEKAMAACCSGNVAALQAMNKSGVCINFKCKHSQASLLHMAAYCGQLSVVMYLMSRGVEWGHTDRDGDTVLHMACMKNMPHGEHEKTLEYLLTTPLSQLMNARCLCGDTALNKACKGKLVDRVKILLHFKADSTVANDKGELPIHSVCTSDTNIEALLYLVELCPDINVRDGDGWTPLMYAAKFGAAAIVKYLIQRGADPNLTQSAGFSSLYLASQEDHVCVCQLLLEAGADPNVRGGTQSITPLHIATHKGYKRTCMHLVRYGADIYQEDIDSDTPLDLAESAQLKQTLLFAHSVRIRQEEGGGGGGGGTPLNPLSCILTQQNTSSSSSCHQASTASCRLTTPFAETETERSEVTYEPRTSPENAVTPDNECGTREQGNGGTRERENGGICSESGGGSGGGGYYDIQSERKESQGEGGGGGGVCREEEEGGVTSREEYEERKKRRDGMLNKLCRMEGQINSYRQRLAEVEEEMRRLCIDKEMLLCRNRSLVAELNSTPSDQNRTSNGTECGHVFYNTPSWLLSSSSEYEVTGPQLNVSLRRFFNVYNGVYRNIPVIVKQVDCVDGWSEDFFSMFQDEIMRISQLQCPYVVQLLGARISYKDRVCAVICEKIARGCLHLVLHEDRTYMEWGQRLRIIRDTCSGMAFIHSHQILHRNLLPRNILIGEHFNAKISDFGFFELKKKCNYYSELKAGSTEPQVYMAPEAMEREEFTAAADVYSFGMVMWEVATGKAPFEEDKKQLSPVILVMRLLLGQRPVFSAHHDQAYQRIAKLCWNNAPNLRPSFTALLPELRALRE